MCGIPYQPPVPEDAVTGKKLTFDQALMHIGGYDKLVSDHGHYLIKVNARQYLWKYRDKRTFCTACGGVIDGFMGQHGRHYSCPLCGASCQFRHEARGHGNLYDEFILYEWRRSVVDPESITLTAAWITRESWHEMPHTAPLEIKPTALYVFRPGKAVTIYKRDRYGEGWSLVKSIHPEHTKGGMWGGPGKDIVIDYMEFRRAIEGTRIGRVFDALREESGRWDTVELMAIANAARRPWLEYLAKCGQSTLAAALLRTDHIPREIIPNQRAGDPRALLGLTEGQWYEIRRDRVKLDIGTLSTLHLLDRLDIGPVKAAEAVRLERVGTYSLSRLLPSGHEEAWQERTIGDMIAPLPDKLRRKIIRRILRDADHISEWSDYYHQLARMGQVHARKTSAKYVERWIFEPDADPMLLMPRDMHMMHQRFIEQENLLREEARAKELENLNATFRKKLLPALRKEYTFEAAGLVLRPYESAREVIAEGSKLSICIGSYARGYLEGNKIICCLRRAEAPDVPWRAVEFSVATGALVQDRGFKNGMPSKEDKPAVDAVWRAWNKRGKNRGRKTA